MDTEERYVEGFNHGYLLTQHEPDLMAKITAGLSSANDYIDGLLAGKQQLELETQLDDLHRLRDTSRDVERGLEHD